MKSQEFTAKKVQDAIEIGLIEMQITESQANIEVVAKGGIFRKAKVRISLKTSEGLKALKFIEGLVEIMNVKCSIELNENDAGAVIEIISLSSGVLIGHRGDVLDAMQYLASIIANDGKEVYKRIVVDCENYRARRIEALENLAKRMADKAVESERRVKLEPMNAFERRVIHSFLSSDERISTSSFGDEPYRCLSITPKNFRPFRPRNNFGSQSEEFNKDNKNENFNRDRSPSDRPYADRRPSDRRPYADRSPSERRPYADRSQSERSSDRPYADRSPSERSSDRPSDRPNSNADRSQSERPSDRPSDRSNSNADRSQSERPYADRSPSDRPNEDRWNEKTRETDSRSKSPSSFSSFEYLGNKKDTDNVDNDVKTEVVE